MAIIKIIVFVVVLISGLVFYTLYSNQANLFQAPGFLSRLTTFLTINTAATSDDHLFEELRTPVFGISADQLYRRVLKAANKAGWVVLAKDDENQNINFVVSSALFKFEDDVFVQVQFIDMNQSSLYIQSSSRKGRGDLAANAGHIQALIKALKQ